MIVFRPLKRGAMGLRGLYRDNRHLRSHSAAVGAMPHSSLAARSGVIPNTPLRGCNPGMESYLSDNFVGARLSAGLAAFGPRLKHE